MNCDGESTGLLMTTRNRLAYEPMRSACLLPCFTKRLIMDQGLQLLAGRFCNESLRPGSFQGTGVVSLRMLS